MKIFKGKSFFFKSALIYIFLVLVIAVISILLWEKPFYNIIVKNFAKPVDSSQVVLVMIDDKSSNVYRWPWARELYSEVLNYINEYTTSKAVLFDVVIPSLDKDHPYESDKKFFKSVQNTKNFIAGSMFLQAKYDDMSSGMIYDNNFYEKYSTGITDRRTAVAEKAGIYNSIMSVPDEYLNTLNNIGFVNFISNYNGYLYEAPDLVLYKGIYYPSLAMKAYLFANDIDSLLLTNDYLVSDRTGMKIPVHNHFGNISHDIKYYKQHNDSQYSHQVYSAIDIINSYRAIKQGKKPIINPDEFNDKFIIVGGNAINMEDVVSTPISVKQPGADVQATILDNLIINDFMISLTDFQNLLIVALMSILTFIIIRSMPIIPSLLSVTILAMLYFMVSVFAFTNDVIMLFITPIAVQAATMIFGYSYRFILEGRSKEKIKNAMGKYLSQDIMKSVVKNIDDVKLGGKKATLTVLFSDIRGFTSMSEERAAEEVSMILNEYFSEMEPIITKYNGVINKFIGDAVMAIFGEPINDINHPQNAVKCAYEMLKCVERLREKWLFEGKPKIEIGIGINTGEAFVGNIGSEKRLEYTVIGDTVNLASRIEGYNKVYKTNLLISTSTYKQVSDIVDVIKIADVTIRGKSKKMDIYEVLKVQK